MCALSLSLVSFVCDSKRATGDLLNISFLVFLLLLVSTIYIDNMSVEDVLNYKPSEDEDFYGLLGCDDSSSVRILIFF